MKSATTSAVLVALLLAACGGRMRPIATPQEPVPGALFTLVPADADVVVMARPAQLFDDESTQRVMMSLWEERAWERFRERTGVDLRELEELVVASHQGGGLTLARGPELDAEIAVREAGLAMAPVEASTDSPRFRRVGFLGSRRVDGVLVPRRVDLSAVASDTVSWIEGTPQLAAAVLSAAGHPADEREHPLLQELAASLWREHAESPFVVIAPRPLGLPVSSGVGLLLAQQEALAASVTPAEGGGLRLVVDLRGAFPPGAAENFRSFAVSLAESDLGAALGVRDALDTLVVEVADGRVRLEAEIGAQVLATGLRTLFLAEMAELLELPPLRQ